MRFFTVILLILTINNCFSQSKTEKIAKARAKEITNKLQLTEKQNEELYQIFLEKIPTIKEIKSKYREDKDLQKKILVEFRSVFDKKMKDVIGEEKAAQLLVILNSKRSKKESSNGNSTPTPPEEVTANLYLQLLE